MKRGIGPGLLAMSNELAGLVREHASRQMQRAATQVPIYVVTALIALAGVSVGLAFWYSATASAGVAVVACAVVLAILWHLSAHLLAEWDRAVILRLGRFRAIRGPGFFMIVPVIDKVMRVVDMRVRTTAFRSGSTRGRSCADGRGRAQALHETRLGPARLAATGPTALHQ